jgi:hypothetical protein
MDAETRRARRLAAHQRRAAERPVWELYGRRATFWGLLVGVPVLVVVLLAHRVDRDGPALPSRSPSWSLSWLPGLPDVPAPGRVLVVVLVLAALAVLVIWWRRTGRHLF